MSESGRVGLDVGAWLESGGQYAVVELLVHGLTAYVHHGCRCDECMTTKRVYYATYYQANREEHLAYGREYRAAHRDALNARQRERRQRARS